jgi:hypothetical protein
MIRRTTSSLCCLRDRPEIQIHAYPEGGPPKNCWLGGLPSCGDWPNTLHRATALQQFREWAAISKPHGANTYTGSTQRFWSEITKIIPFNLTQIKDASGNRCITISLAELRARFEAYLQGSPICSVTGILPVSAAAPAGAPITQQGRKRVFTGIAAGPATPAGLFD